jgi:DNA-binding CsgD family transcriptional regulator
MVTVLLANLRWRQGRWREAYSHSTLYALSPDLPAISSAWGSAAAASMAAALGNADATQRFAQRAFANTPDHEVPLVRAWANAALGHLHLSQNQPVAALAYLRQSAQHVAAMELGQPLFFLWWGDYLEALLGVGAAVVADAGAVVSEVVSEGEAEREGVRDEVRELLTQLEQRNEQHHLAWIEGICQRTRGMLASSTEEADSCFKQSVHVLQAYPFEVARTKLAWAQKRMVNVDKAIAMPTAQADDTKTSRSTSEILHEAIQEFQRLQAATWEATAQRLATSLQQPNLEPDGLGTTQEQPLHEHQFVSSNPFNLDIGASDHGSGTAHATQLESPVPSSRVEETLSEAELRVALIVAAGRSNREVATDLYISVRTVEFHLGSIFRKLSVKNRNGVINFFVDNRPHM